MSDPRLDVVDYWWTVELFSPPSIEKSTGRSRRPYDRQVIDWRPSQRLPWETLPAPPVRGKKTKVWRHQLLLGIYRLEDAYESLHRVFGEDEDAFDGHRGAESAAASIDVDADGRLLSGSTVLSAALWATGRIYNPGPEAPGWMLGFSEAQDAFENAVDSFDGDRRDQLNADTPPPVDEDAVMAILRLAQVAAGLDHREVPLALRGHRIRIVSVLIDRARDTDVGGFLNSFFLDGLAHVREQVSRGDVGAALNDYLTPDANLDTARRRDVMADRAELDRGTAINRLPTGRWPTDPNHPLAHSQQFAVNAAINDLTDSAGLLGVNGPPGTGKTTMLRDILAANVVERATRLASLTDPHAAFTGEVRWKDGEYWNRVPVLAENLTGFEMVVASANNGAVENVTAEIPTRSSLGPAWHANADYFADIATAVLATALPSDAAPANAWGLVAARLGRKQYRSEFRSAFWFDSHGTGVRGMNSQLTAIAANPTLTCSWGEARRRFQAARATVDSLLAARQAAEARRTAQGGLEAAVDCAAAKAGSAASSAAEIYARWHAHQATLAVAHQEYERASRAREHALAAKPSLLDNVLSWGKTRQQWSAQFARHVDAAYQANVHLDQAQQYDVQLRGEGSEAEQQVAHAQQALERTRHARDAAATAIAADRVRFDGYPAEPPDELCAPWLDSELDTARSELFLAALDLHKDFLARTVRKSLPGLRAAIQVVGGSHPPNLTEQHIRAAWQLFFLVVPLASTTFASMDRMFNKIGREGIGWLFIDEAGQACPQHAASAIWRARRVIAVGDPLQLEPVVTTPPKMLLDLANAFHVSDTWIPPRASAQTLADRIARTGTYLDQRDDPVWVSSPLRVHRRCDNPMFDISNTVAYNGMMIHAVHRDPHDHYRTGGPIPPSAWLDSPADTPQSHLQNSDIQQLHELLTTLNNAGVDRKDIFVIAPFRIIANYLEGLTERYPGLRAGTIHKAQGKEAAVVILVLGGDPSRPGAKAWAASKPNLVNVAASRARRRIYVIGDRAAWNMHPYFAELSDYLIDYEEAASVQQESPRDIAH